MLTYPLASSTFSPASRFAHADVIDVGVRTGYLKEQNP